MKVGKFLAASVILGGINFLPCISYFNAENLQIISVAHAEIKNYTASNTAMFDFGEDDEFIINTVKNVAKMRAIQSAKEKAGVYLTSYSKVVNGNLTSDDISVVTNNTAELLDVKYKKIPIQAQDAKGNDTGKVGLLYEATVTVKIDTDELKKYIKMTPQERLKLINQNKNLQQSNTKIDDDFENLRRQSGSSNNTQIIIQLYKIENRFTAQQKLQEGNVLYYQRDYQGAISKYNEAIKLNPDYEEANSNLKIADTSSKSTNSTKNDRISNSKIPQNAVEYKGHYYYIFNNCNTWEQAQKYCESLGGHLAIIRNAEDNNKLYNIMLQFGCKSAYFGLTDAEHEGKWIWVNGEPLKYSNWHSGEPNGGSYENYAMFYIRFSDGTWNDGNFGAGVSIEDTNAFICEWDSYSAIK